MTTGVKAPPKTHRHPEATSLLRPDVGTQAQFNKKKPPVTYRYDSSLSPVLEWDGQNSAREKGEELIARILTAGIDKTKPEGFKDPGSQIHRRTDAIRERAGRLFPAALLGMATIVIPAACNHRGTRQAGASKKYKDHHYGN